MLLFMILRTLRISYKFWSYTSFFTTFRNRDLFSNSGFNYARFYVMYSTITIKHKSILKLNRITCDIVLSKDCHRMIYDDIWGWIKLNNLEVLINSSIIDNTMAVRFRWIRQWVIYRMKIQSFELSVNLTSWSNFFNKIRVSF